MVGLFIDKAVKRPGSLSRQLDIPEKKNIPFELLEKIKRTPTGERIRNPTASGKRIIPVTDLLKKRANLALNLKNIRRKG